MRTLLDVLAELPALTALLLVGSAIYLGSSLAAAAILTGRMMQ